MNAILIVVAAASLLRSGHPAPAPREQVVEIEGGDFAFSVPADIHAGPTTFRLLNRGKVRHELSIALLRVGATVEQFMAARQAKARPGQLVEASLGVIFADPGKRGIAGLGATLLAGREYLVICNSKDSPDAPEHSALGMFASLRVPEGAENPGIETPIDTIVATDYAFRHPETLVAGHHAFAFVNSGSQRHELKIFVLPKGQKLDAFMEEHTEWRNAHRGSNPNAAVAVLVAARGVSPAGVVELDLEPGREYAMTCDFADAPGAKEHTALGMYGSIRAIARKTAGRTRKQD